MAALRESEQEKEIEGWLEKRQTAAYPLLFSGIAQFMFGSCWIRFTQGNMEGPC